MAVKARLCNLCGATLREGKAKCPGCGFWQFAESSGTVEEGKHDISNDGSVLLEDIDDTVIQRVKTDLIDDCLGGGVVRTDVILIGGGPGAGKSTLMLQIAQALCKYGLVMYISAEEDVKAIKMRAKRLKVNTKRKLRLLPALSGVANMGAMLMAHKPKFIIADSLDALSGHNDDEEIAILTIIKKYCVELEAPAFIISQVNKAGDYAGLKAKQHAVDVLLTFDQDPEEMGPDGVEHLRVMETIKNRSGRAGVQTIFAMGELGLSVDTSLDDPEEDDPEEDDSD